MRRFTYLYYEVLRTIRNRMFLVFSLAFPLVLFLVIAGGHRNATEDGISLPLYFMTGMAAWGAMTSVISSGARISAEREIGWTRQLRVTPIRPFTYFTAKVICGYMMALFTLVILALAGVAIGVRLDATQWLSMLGLILLGLVPFTVMGIMLGHLIRPDTLGPAVGGVTSLFALFGGAWGPLVTGGLFLKIVKLLPSYWLVQAGKSALGVGNAWPAEAWIVVGLWSVVLARISVVVYKRDTQRA